MEHLFCSEGAPGGIYYYNLCVRRAFYPSVVLTKAGEPRARLLPTTLIPAKAGINSSRRKQKVDMFCVSTFWGTEHCASGGIRTPNNCFEGSHDIHFTTDA